MHQYLMFTLEGPLILKSGAKYGHNQKANIDGEQYVTHHYHYAGKGPYGVLISSNNPVSHDQIQASIERTGLVQLPW